MISLKVGRQKYGPTLPKSAENSKKEISYGAAQLQNRKAPQRQFLGNILGGKGDV